MKIFALDCAATAASTALIEDGKLLGECLTNVSLTHSQTLLPMAEQLFLQTKVAPTEVDVYAVSAGPGSFTGVRIGIAAVKGLADAVQKPCLPISALETAAYPFADFQGLVCPVMDARCNQVYTALFENGKRLLEDTALKIPELFLKLQEIGKPVLFCADGADKVYAQYQAAELMSAFSAHTAPAQLCYPRASSCAYLAQQALENGAEPIPADQLLPVYLRLPQAQRELNNKEKNKEKTK